MAEVVVSGAHLLTVKYSVAGQDAAVVLGGYCDPVDFPEAPMDSVDALTWLNNWHDAMRQLQTISTVCLGATYRHIGIAEGISYDVPQPTLEEGATSDDLAVAAGSTLIRWATAQGGRRGKGRTFVPGLGHTSIKADGRTYESAHVTAVGTAIGLYLNDTFGGFLQPAVVSRKFLAVNAITAGSISTVVGIQRRRMR